MLFVSYVPCLCAYVILVKYCRFFFVIGHLAVEELNCEISGFRREDDDTLRESPEERSSQELN